MNSHKSSFLLLGGQFLLLLVLKYHIVINFVLLGL